MCDSFGHLEKKGSELIDQPAASVGGETDGGSLSRIDVCKERVFQIIWKTTDVAGRDLAPGSPTQICSMRPLGRHGDNGGG